MRRFIVGLLFFGFLGFGPALRAQVDPMLEQGIKPFGGYSSDFESISMVNGGLTIHIPLFSYPQRGNKITLNLRLNYESSGWTGSVSGEPPHFLAKMVDLLLGGFHIDEDQHLMEQSGCPGLTILGYPQIMSPEGSSHPLGQTSLTGQVQGFESIDSTGIRLSGFEFDSTGNKLVSAGIITDAEGIVYTPAPLPLEVFLSVIIRPGRSASPLPIAKRIPMAIRSALRRLRVGRTLSVAEFHRHLLLVRAAPLIHLDVWDL
jgi:hypothetical protein